MDTTTDQQRIDARLQLWQEIKKKYGGLFSEDITIRERQALVRADLPNRFREYSDNHFLGKDVETLTQDFMRRFIEQDPTPDLEFNGSDPVQKTSNLDFVVVSYLIPADKNTMILTHNLPESLRDPGLSEHARIIPRSGVVSNTNRVNDNDIKHFLELEYEFPIDVWESQVKGQLKRYLDIDLEWLRSVIEDFHDAFEEHTREMTKLIHIETEKRWRHAMDVASELANAPLPEEDSEKTEEERKSARYRVHKPYLYGQQKGICNGCKRRFCFERMTVDHIIPQKEGGGHELANLQLLCQPCGSLKADGTHEELIEKLNQRGPVSDACCECH